MIRIPYTPRLLAGTRVDFYDFTASTSAGNLGGADPARVCVTLCLSSANEFGPAQYVSIGVYEGERFHSLATVGADQPTATVRVEDVGDAITRTLFIRATGDCQGTVTILSVLNPHAEQ